MRISRDTGAVELAEGELATPVVTCWLCGDPLHRIADTAADEYVWVDAAGYQHGTDADLRGLVCPATGEADPDGRLAWLAAELTRGSRQRRRAEHTWLYWARSREYSALKVRLDTKGTFHVHQVATGDLPAWDGGPVPECCGWPMWLRPSGWHCRQGCGAVIERQA
jgi:hypothetical protein